jgi:hypothetical protein
MNRLLSFILLVLLKYSSCTNIFLNPVLPANRSQVICYFGNNLTFSPLVQGNDLCYIEKYTGIAGDFYIQAGDYLINSRKQMIINRCTGFSINQTDIGYGTCTPLPFETYVTKSLCICSTFGCNQNFNTCQAAVNTASPRPSPLPPMVNTFTQIILCQETNFAHYVSCQQTPYINFTACTNYYFLNAVICMRELLYPYGPYFQMGYIQEEASYQAVQILMLLTLNNSILDQNSQSAIVQYSGGNGSFADSYCLCTYSSCNVNFQTCAPNLTNYTSLWTIQQSYTGTISTTSTLVTTTSAIVTTTSAMITNTTSTGKQKHPNIFILYLITYVFFFFF